MARRRSGSRKWIGAFLAFAVGALLIAACGAQVPTPGPDAMAQPVVDGLVGFLVLVWLVVALVVTVGAKPRRRARRRTSRRRAY